MAVTSTCSPSATDRPASEDQIKRALKPIAMTYPSLLPMELTAMIMVLGETPVWAIEQVVKSIVTGTDGRTMAEAAFAPKAPQLAMMARKIVEHEMIRRKNAEWKRQNPPKPVRVIEEDPMAVQQNIEEFRAKLRLRIKQIA